VVGLRRRGGDGSWKLGLEMGTLGERGLSEFFLRVVIGGRDLGSWGRVPWWWMSVEGRDICPWEGCAVRGRNGKNNGILRSRNRFQTKSNIQGEIKDRVTSSHGSEGRLSSIDSSWSVLLMRHSYSGRCAREQ
jgi:hypothetical protein